MKRSKGTWGVSAVVATGLLIACGGTPQSGSTEVVDAEVGISGVWLPRGVAGSPSREFSFLPDRLWFWGIVDAEPAPLTLQGDDNGNSFVSAMGKEGIIWQNTVEETQDLVVVGDVAIVAAQNDNGSSGSTTLTVMSVSDGTVQRTVRIDGYYQVMGFAGGVLLVDTWDEQLKLARLDLATFEPELFATVDSHSGVSAVDRGVLAWGAEEAVLLEPGDPWTVTRWAAGTEGILSSPPERLSPWMPVAVMGDWLVMADGEAVRLFALDGSAGPSATASVGDISAVWAADERRVVVVGGRGLELFEYSEGRLTKVTSRPGAGRLGPTGLVDGAPLIVWYADGMGNVLRVGEEDFAEVLAFTEEGPVSEDSWAPEQVMFTRDSVLVAGRRAEEKTSFLTAYSPSAGVELWTIETPAAPESEGMWTVGDGVIVWVDGYVLIPTQLTVFR